MPSVDVRGAARSPAPRRAPSPSVAVLVHRHPDADDEVRARRLRGRRDHPAREAPSGLEVAAELVVAPVGGRGQEPVEEVAVGLAARCRRARPPRSARRPRRSRSTMRSRSQGSAAFGKAAVGGLAQRRRRRPPAASRRCSPAGAAAEVGDLAHHRRAGLVHVVGQPSQPGRRSRPCRAAGCRTTAGCPGATTADPPIMVSPTPPTAFSRW